MVSYDTTQIALFVTLVLAAAVIGTTLVLGLAARSLLRNRSARTVTTTSQPRLHGRLAFHH